MRFLLTLLVFLSVKAEAAPARIYFFDGFLVPVPITSEIRAHSQIRQHIKTNSIDAELIVTHSNFWSYVCNELSSLPVSQRPEKLILIGHSLGVGGAVEVSRCLKDYPVDLIISIDSESLGFFEDEIIPDNVRTNYNFYQTLDLFVKGNKNNRRPGANQTGIHNVFIDVPLSVSPHIQIVDELFERKIFLELLDQTLNGPTQQALNDHLE